MDGLTGLICIFADAVIINYRNYEYLVCDACRDGALVHHPADALQQIREILRGPFPARPENHDIWRAGAPAIDILSPDIYLADFPTILRMYSRSGNPVFIPESHSGQGGAANAAFAIGEMGAIGYSPFGLENGAVSPQNQTFATFYQDVHA